MKLIRLATEKCGQHWVPPTGRYPDREQKSATAENRSWEASGLPSLGSSKRCRLNYFLCERASPIKELSPGEVSWWQDTHEGQGSRRDAAWWTLDWAPCPVLLKSPSLESSSFGRDYGLICKANSFSGWKTARDLPMGKVSPGRARSLLYEQYLSNDRRQSVLWVDWYLVSRQSLGTQRFYFSLKIDFRKTKKQWNIAWNVATIS